MDKSTMRAVVYYSMDNVVVEDRPIPAIGAGELLVRAVACGLCGGEAMPWYKKAKPKVLGHEQIGEIVEVGEGVSEWRVGDRIFVNNHIARALSPSSLRGHYTIDPYYQETHVEPGGMCQYYRVPAEHQRVNIHRIPDHISDAEATTIEPWGCVMGGLKVCNIQPGDTVAVVGAGFMGQGFIHMAPLFGAGRVVAVDFSDWRLEKAKLLGATHTINAKRDDPVAALRAVNDGRLADVAVAIAPTVKAWDQALALTGPGGTVHLGAPVAPEEFWTCNGNRAYFDEITVTAKYSADHFDTYQYLRLLDAGRVHPKLAITHHFDIEQAPEAFRMLVEAQESLKLVIYPNGIRA